jgi:hypothetical protein
MFEGELTLAKAAFQESESRRLAACEALRDILDDEQWASIFPDDDAGVDGVDF